MATEKVLIGIRVDKELKEKLQVLAQKDNRSLSNYIEQLLLEKVKRSKI